MLKTKSDDQFQDGELIFYRTDDGVAKVEVVYLGETFWLSQKRLAELFGVDLRTISYHLGEIYASGELKQDATLQKIRIVQNEGNRRLAANSSTEVVKPNASSSA